MVLPLALVFVIGMVVGSDASLREACAKAPAAQHAKLKCPPR